jgi:hypothetical protein
MHIEPSRSSRAANDCETARKLSSTNALGILHVSKSSTSASVVPGAGVSRGAKLTLSATTLWLTDILTSHGQLPRFSTRDLAQTSDYTYQHLGRHFRHSNRSSVMPVLVAPRWVAANNEALLSNSSKGLRSAVKLLKELMFQRGPVEDGLLNQTCEQSVCEDG